jgi:hypothetical protein
MVFAHGLSVVSCARQGVLLQGTILHGGCRLRAQTVLQRAEANEDMRTSFATDVLTLLSRELVRWGAFAAISTLECNLVLNTSRVRAACNWYIHTW